MVEHVKKIQLGELTRVRLSCKVTGCGGVVEAPLAALERLTIVCPLCHLELRRHGNDPGLTELVQGVRGLQNASVPFVLEFVLPADGE